ncbi:MAG TPA: isochorismatase family protein [Pirellulales bacterium]
MSPDDAPAAAAPLPRSPEMMSVHDTALLVVDVQTRLVNLIAGHERIVWSIRRLLDGAKILGVRTAATEQYPKGLGGTVEELAARLPPPRDKLAFSCGVCGDIFAEWQASGIFKVLVVGIETHVCVQQTVLDLLAHGFRTFVAVDATGSRYSIDSETALRRMDSAGATLTTTESALFEWCRVAGTPEFKQISRMVQEKPPAEHAE